MKVLLPYPAAPLWPNKPAHWSKVHKAKKKARRDAYWAAHAIGNYPIQSDRITVKITVGGRPKGPLPDKDNCVSAAKALLDGIADALGVNDNRFEAPVVEFSPERSSSFTFELSDACDAGGTKLENRAPRNAALTAHGANRNDLKRRSE